MQFMKLDRKGQCAVRVMFLLARRGRDAPVSFDDIACEVGVSRPVLGRTLRVLTDSNFVERVDAHPSRWRLRVAPDVICLADIVDAVEGEEFAFQCPLGERSCKSGNHCHTCWAFIEAELQATETLGKYTLADLVGEIQRKGLVRLH